MNHQVYLASFSVGILAVAVCLQLMTVPVMAASRLDKYSQDLRDIYEQVYGQKTETTIEPSQVHDLLKLLYVKAKKEGTFVSGIEELIDLGEFSRDKCHWVTFMRMDNQMSDRSRGQTTIDLYLDYCAERQFSLCKDIFAKELELSVNNLSEENKKDLLLLDDIFIKPYQQVGLDRLERPVMPTRIGERLMSFFGGRRGQRPEQVGDTTSWTPETQDNIIKQIELMEKFCQQVVDIAGDSVANYNLQRLRPTILVQVNHLAAEWVPRVNLCHAFQDIFTVIRPFDWRDGPERWSYSEDNFASTKYAPKFPKPF